MAVLWLRCCGLLLLLGSIVAQDSKIIEINMLEQCGTSDVLSLDTTGSKCAVNGILANKREQRLTVEVADADYDMLITFRTAGGIAQMFVYMPGADTLGMPSFSADELYSTNITQESYAALSGAVLSGNPGTYTILLVPVSGNPQYDLMVQLQDQDIKLRQEEVDALRDFSETCCAQRNDAMMMPGIKPWCTEFIPLALADDRIPSRDICHRPPNMCNSDGSLIKLMMPNAGMDCSAFPDIRGFPSLEGLDLSGNIIRAELNDVVEGIRDTELSRLFLRNTGISGELDCDIMLPTMTHLSLATNNIDGTLPSCIVQGPELKELFLSRNFLSGKLPEFDLDGKLETFMAFQQSGAGFDGQLPKSLINATSLKYFSVAGNKMSGPVWRLPKNMVYFNASDNQLDALPDFFPPTISVVDMHNNKLKGEQNQLVFAPSDMTTLVLSNNQLSGTIPRIPRVLQVLDLGRNSFTGEVPELPNTLEKIKLCSNQLTGELPEAPEALRVADFSHNQFTGPLPDSYASAEDLRRLDVNSNRINAIPEDWNAPELRVISLASNALGGVLPITLATLPRIHQIDLSNNTYVDGFEAFLKASQDNPYKEVGVSFNVSYNQLKGAIPGTITSLAFFRTDTAIWEYEDGVPMMHTLDVSHNSLEGAYPVPLLGALVKLVAECQCNVTLRIMGGQNKVLCPGDDPSSGLGMAEQEIVDVLGLKCLDKGGNTVLLVGRERVAGTDKLSLTDDAKYTFDNTTKKGSIDTSKVAPIPVGGSGSGGSGGGRSPGIIALIVLAVLALICLLLAACWFGYRRFGNPFTGGYKPSAQARYDHLERGELLTSPRAQAAKDKVTEMYKKTSSSVSSMLGVKRQGYEKMSDAGHVDQEYTGPEVLQRGESYAQTAKQRPNSTNAQMLADYEEPRKLQDVPLR